MSKKKGGFDSPLKTIYLACEITITMKLRCGILINQYPLPGTMCLDTYWWTQLMTTEAQELLFTVTTSIRERGGRRVADANG